LAELGLPPPLISSASSGAPRLAAGAAVVTALLLLGRLDRRDRIERRVALRDRERAVGELGGLAPVVESSLSASARNV